VDLERGASGRFFRDTVEQYPKVPPSLAILGQSPPPPPTSWVHPLCPRISCDFVTDVCAVQLSSTCLRTSVHDLRIRLSPPSASGTMQTSRLRLRWLLVLLVAARAAHPTLAQPPRTSTGTAATGGCLTEGNLSFVLHGEGGTGSGNEVWDVTDHYSSYGVTTPRYFRNSSLWSCGEVTLPERSCVPVGAW